MNFKKCPACERELVHMLFWRCFDCKIVASDVIAGTFFFSDCLSNDRFSREEIKRLVKLRSFE